MGKILVIGGANIDIIAKSKENLIKADSNISKMEISFGGVARNIVENLARLGHEVHFISALGRDSFGEALKEDLFKLNVDLSKSLSTDARTGLYLAICEPDGEMEIAACDNEIIKKISPEYLEGSLDYINSFDHLVFDTNLLEESLDFLFKNVRGKIYVDATSVEKAKLLEKHLSRIALLKGNRLEIEALSNVDGNIQKQIKALLAFGVRRVVATSGPDFIYYNLDEIKKTRPLLVDPLSTTGSGDAFMSGLLHGILQDLPFDRSIEYGKRAAAATLQVVGACNKDLSKYLD